MLNEGQVKIFSPQNTAGVSQEKSVAVTPETIGINGDSWLHAAQKSIYQKHIQTLLLNR